MTVMKLWGENDADFEGCGMGCGVLFLPPFFLSLSAPLFLFLSFACIL